MNATRFLMAAAVLGSVIGASQANAQCSSNTGSCNTTNTASVVVNALVKLDMGTTNTSLTSPSVAQIESGALIADAGPSFTIKANRSWTLNIKTTAPSLVDLRRLTRRHEAHQRPHLVERGRRIVRRYQLQRRCLSVGSGGNERPRSTGFLQDRLGCGFHPAEQRARYVQLADRVHPLGAVVEAIQFNVSL